MKIKKMKIKISGLVEMLRTQLNEVNNLSAYADEINMNYAMLRAFKKGGVDAPRAATLDELLERMFPEHEIHFVRKTGD